MNYELIYNQNEILILEKTGWGRINTIIARFYSAVDAQTYIDYLNEEK